ncbi:peptidase S8/S53 domain-containing protein [Paraphysoderma sedebokerense]|nr:peptidase S8/S53 domain-containing protein [Paraphysoderma sedebokerense]
MIYGQQMVFPLFLAWVILSVSAKPISEWDGPQKYRKLKYIPITGEYLIKFPEGAPKSKIDNHYSYVESLLKQYHGIPVSTHPSAARNPKYGQILRRYSIGNYTHGYHAYSVILPFPHIRDFLNSTIVKTDNVEVAQNKWILGGMNDNAVEMKSADIVNGATLNWGLHRISQGPIEKNLQSYKYSYPSAAGRDVDIYILDGGVDIAHPEFEGRAREVSFIRNRSQPGEKYYSGDFDHHGTFVASIAASKTLGVAKKANIISVKYKHRSAISRYNEATTLLDQHDALYFALTEASKKPNASVINVSQRFGERDDFFIEGDPIPDTDVFEKMVESAVETYKVVIVKSAGNEYAPSCAFSIARRENLVINVAALNKQDEIGVSSAYGNCVTLMAPGVDIIGLASRKLDTDRRFMNTTSNDGHLISTGTSFAAPHVAGIAAIYLSLGVPSSRIKNELIQSGQQNRIPDSNTEGISLLRRTKNRVASVWLSNPSM